MINEDDIITMNQFETIINANETEQQINSEEQIINDTNAKRAVQTILELNEDELNKLEEHLKCKLMKNSENFLQQFDNLRANNEKLKIEYEQHFLELESEYNECRIKLEFESRNSHLNQQKVNEFDDKLAQLSKENKILNDDKETLASNVHRLNTVNLNLEAEKRDLHIRLDKYIRENDRLNEEWKSMNCKLTDLESKLATQTAKLEEVQNRESTITFREKQFQSDKQRLLNEIEWLNSELEKKSTQMLQLRSEYNQKTFEFESKLEDLQSDNKKFKSLNESLQQANQTMESQIEELTEKLQQLRDNYAQSKQDYQEESQSREKIIQLYQEENANCKIKLDDAAQAIDDLKQMVVELKDEYSKLLDEKTQQETAFDAKLKENIEVIAKLEQELKNANELLSIAKRKGATVLSEADIEQLSPAAAVASRLLKNGMSLTQIYSEYVNLSEELQKEKNENQRLTSYINEIVKEIEEKAPALRRQKHEYEEAVKTIDNLTNQLENAMMDYEVLKSKSDDSIKKYNLVSSENIRLRQDCNDLSRQVTVLLHEVEKLRSKLLSSRKSLNKSDLEQSINDTTTDAEVSSSSEVISKDVFLFRNIEEMQKKNQELIRRNHELTEKKQSEEKNEFEQKTKEYNEKLNLALRELEELKLQREKYEQVLEEIRKQRDTYKQLLNSQQQTKQNQSADLTFYTSTPGQIQKTKPVNLSPTDNLFKSDKLDELKKQLDDKSQLLDKLQKQFDTYQTEMINTNRMLNEEIEQFRVNNSELNMKLALSDSRLESTLEKCKSLNTAIDKLRKELETTKERNSKLNELIIKHEQSISLTTQELNKSHEKVCELETKLHSIQFERDMLKSNHERIIKERDLLLQENSSRSVILSNLEMIKNSCERNERETKLIYTQKIEQLEKENLMQRKQIEQDLEKNSVLLKSWQTQYDQLNEQYEKEKQENEKSRQQLADYKLKHNQQKEKCDELEAKLHSNELIVQMSRNTKSSSAISRLTHLEEETKDLQMKLSLAEKEIVSLKIQLEESRGHAKQYKTIAETMEKTVRESSETNEKTKLILETNIKELEQQLEQLKSEYNQLLNEKNQLSIQLDDLKQTSESQINSLEKDKKKLENELDLLNKRVKNLEFILAERAQERDDYVAKITILEEQSVSYETKLNENETRLNEKSVRIHELEQLIQQKTNELDLINKSKSDAQQTHESSERLIQETVDNLRKENESQTVQINLLQQELSRLGQDLIILQKQDSFKTTSITSSTSSLNDEQTASNLLEINRYLRTQKDQLDEKYEKIKLDFEINQSRLKSAENELEFTRQQAQAYESEIQHLKSSIDLSKTTPISSSNENFNLMLDTNKRLKDELDSLNEENSRVKNDLTKLEDEIQNLKASLSESELKNESIRGENNCLVIEIKRWKERCDALLRGSDHADEWSRIKDEMQKAQEKAQDLTDMINELRTNLSDSNSKNEQLQRELEQLANQTAGEKAKIQQDFDSYRQDRTKREEMFKTLVNELREVVMLVQRELELKSLDWSMKVPMSEKLKIIKEEIQALKLSIQEKLKTLKEEAKQRPKQLDDMSTELDQINKRLEESDNKLKEKDTRIGQMNNLIAQMKTKLSTFQKAKDDAVKELTDYKNANPQQESPNEQKNELDTLKSRYLQSQFENERLKKELASFDSNKTQQLQPKPQQQSSVQPQTQIQNQQQQQSQTTSPQQKVAFSQQTISSTESNNTPPPTAYIAPSRVTKQQQPQIQQPNQSANNLSLRRTAAVQPTLHESSSTKQQLVQPLVTETQQIEPVNETFSVAPTTSTAGTSASFLNKRTREDDNHDESAQQASSNNSNNNKKQRGSSENYQFITDQTTQQETFVNQGNFQSDQNEYIVINDEIQSNDINELQESQEEIILDDDDDTSNNNQQQQQQQQPNDNEYEVIITEVNRRNENLQQNVLSSTSESQQQQQQQQQANLDEYENVVEVDNNDLNEDDIEDENEENLDDNEDESNQRNAQDDDEQRSSPDDLRLDDDQENTDSNLRTNSDTNEENQNTQEETTDSQSASQFDDSQQQQQQQQQPDNSANQQTESSQTQSQQLTSIQSSVVSSNLNQSNITSTNTTTTSTPTTSSTNSTNLATSNQTNNKTNLFGQTLASSASSSIISLTQNRNISLPSTTTFGSTSINQEQRREAPKPIVWETTAAASNQFSNQSANQSSFRIRRPPVTQTNLFGQAQQQQQQQQQQVQSQTNLAQVQQNQINYFQDNVIQPTFRMQSNQFQLQQNQFVANQPNQATLNIQQRQLIRNARTTQAISPANQQQLQQQQQQQQNSQQIAPTGQQTIRLMNRGGGVVGQRRVGNVNQLQNQSGAPGANLNPNQSNPAQRGGRNNF